MRKFVVIDSEFQVLKANSKSQITLNEEILIFNRVQKAGSTTFNKLLTELALVNNFTMVKHFLRDNKNYSRQFNATYQVSNLQNKCILPLCQI